MRKSLKTFLSALLAVVAALLLLSSCNSGGGEVESTASEGTTAAALTDIDLSEYKMIRPSIIASDPLSEVVRMRKTLGEKLGKSVDIFRRRRLPTPGRTVLSA